MIRSDMGSLRAIIKTSSENVTRNFSPLFVHISLHFITKLVPGFIDHVAIECLVRVALDYGTLREVRKVCKKWREVFSDCNAGILKERRERNLQQPSMFLIPCDSCDEFVCATYKSIILIVGGRHYGYYEKQPRELWIIDTINGKVKSKTEMLKDRDFCVAAAVGDSLFAIGGDYLEGMTIDPQSTIECYDFAKEKWGYVSSLPYSTMPKRCYVDTFSSSTIKLFISGYGYDEDHNLMSGELSYCTSNDTWEKVDVASYQSPVPLSPLKWMWHSGKIRFRKTMTSYKEAAAVSDEETTAWQFPSEMTIPAHVATALIQPTNGSVEDKNPLISKSLTNKSMLFWEEENQTRRAAISGTVEPSNAAFYTVSAISRVERTSVVAHTVPINAMRNDMFFHEPINMATDERLLSCLFAVLFF